ncbi:hypothetical protein PIB30_016826 [Stylosanthes scabra]|uniref:Uncharacterized protein n=1 Tax=Stylosanthes scabra TaxID=79078 RepID=A0ABU6S761_9FABA|nr:hypothetical protein [Stylosanthes scabra]
MELGFEMGSPGRVMVLQASYVKNVLKLADYGKTGNCQQKTSYKYDHESTGSGIKHLPNFHNLPPAKILADLGIGVPCRYTPESIPAKTYEGSLWAHRKAGFWVPLVT